MDFHDNATSTHVKAGQSADLSGLHPIQRTTAFAT
jgi:hypothetical protein